MFGVIAGVLSLIVLDVAVSPKGSSNTAGVLGFFAGAVRWFTDPTVPGIPNLAAKKAGATTSAGATTGSNILT